MKTNRSTIIISISTLVVGLFLGWLIFGSSSRSNSDADRPISTEIATETTWTCSMHPQIRQSEPGDCAICGMDLIPLESLDDEIDPLAVRMSATAMQLAQVQTMVVGKGNAEKSIRLSGKIQADERLLFTQSSHIPGRIEQLNVNFTGDFIAAGQILAKVYSPDLVTAQEELLEAGKIKESQPILFAAAKEKLKNWKLTDKQIDQIVASNKIMERFPILADVSGYVTKKQINLGDYIKQGDALYEIIDLSKVWVLFDVYESDMPWINKGDSVSYTVHSLPGKTFSGKISYIDPVINPETRVARARLEQNNSKLLLKPEMFVNGSVQVKAYSGDTPIIVPKSAVMWTGKRSVVYVMQQTAQSISFKMREVTLGPELGASYVIESGLQSGEEIAINGTFSIDAAAQLAGKPSMMNPEGGEAVTGHNHGGGTPTPAVNKAFKPEIESISTEAKNALKSIFDPYFEIKKALVNDNSEEAKRAGQSLKTALGKVNMNLFTGKTHEIYMQYSASLSTSLDHIEHLDDIDVYRKNFIDISLAMIGLAEAFKPLSATIYVQHCPMADNYKGADWLSLEKEIRNPYFGAAMLKCGEVINTLE